MKFYFLITKIVLAGILFGFFLQCSGFPILGGKENKSLYSLYYENGIYYRIELFPKNYLLKAKGPVSCTNCSEKDSSKSESMIKSLSKNGVWEEFRLIVKDGQEDIPSDKKIYISIKSVQGEYSNNLKYGLWKFYRDDGTIIMESDYFADKRNGKSILYGEKGQITEISYYKDGMRQGEFSSFRKNGLTREKGNYSNDKRMGYWKIYYTGDYTGKEISPNRNTLMEELECENDLRNGVYKKYNPNGLLAEVSYFLKGSKSGITTYYFANGNKSSEGKFESLPPDDKEYNKEDSSYRSYKKLYQNSLFHCGDLDRKNDHNMVVHQKIGEWKEYYPTGQLFSIGSYQGGIKSGEWKYFSSNGTLRAQGKMKNDFFCFYCSNEKINSKFEYYGSSLDFYKYESLTENVKIYGEDGILEGEGNLESSEVAIDNKTNEFVHNYKKGVPFKIYKNKKVISEYKRDDSGSVSMIKSGENGDLFGTGPSLNSTPNGCWTLKNGIKKFYSMGIEDSLNGELQNCK